MARLLLPARRRFLALLKELLLQPTALSKHAAEGTALALAMSGHMKKQRGARHGKAVGSAASFGRKEALKPELPLSQRNMLPASPAFGAKSQQLRLRFLRA